MLNIVIIVIIILQIYRFKYYAAKSLQFTLGLPFEFKTLYDKAALRQILQYY